MTFSPAYLAAADEISLTLDAPHIRSPVEVRDDGRGISPAPPLGWAST
jgi:hypothetical protein